MHHCHLLLRSACTQLGPRAVDAALALAGGIAPSLLHLRALSSASGILRDAVAASSLPSASCASGPWSLTAPSTARRLHSSPGSLAGDTDAAVRRLAAARLRRERVAEAASRAPRLSPEGGSGGPTDPPTHLPGAEVVAASTTAVTPVEGKASDVQLATALEHSALIVTRPIEWGTVIFGYEQANKYTVYDETGTIVALVAEDFGGFGKELGRQLLRTRRSFTATIFSADGTQVLFRLRRPAYLVSSTMYVEDGEGNPVGEIHQRWHLLKRNYDLYLGKSQFAAISGNFLAWEFELKDSAGGTLALVDRNFSGFAKEIFTDAGKYVIHFGAQDQGQGQQQAQQQAQQHLEGQQPPQVAGTAVPAAAVGPSSSFPPSSSAAVSGGPPPPPPPPPVTPMAVARTEVAVIPGQGGNQLSVARPLALSERMVALACAITIDYDYFSQHSHSGGGLVPPLVILPGGGGGGVEGGHGGAGGQPSEGPGVAGAAAAGAASGVGGEVPLGGGAAGVGGGGGGGGAGVGIDGGEWAGGSGPAAPPGGTGMAPGGGWGGDGFDPGQSWKQGGGGEGEMRWDIGGDGGSGGGGEEGSGGVTGLLGSLWGLFSGDD